MDYIWIYDTTLIQRFDEKGVEEKPLKEEKQIYLFKRFPDKVYNIKM